MLKFHRLFILGNSPNVGIVVFFCLFSYVQVTKAQISPPGLDGATMASWWAFSINENYAKKWSTSVYVGMETQNNPNSASPFLNRALNVLNQETSYKFNSRWLLALCTSWRQQQLYSDESPYTLEDPSLRNEIRWYMRLFHKVQFGKADFAFSFRPEYRSFYTPDWESMNNSPQCRFRVKGQATFHLNETKTLDIVLANEVLTATNKQTSENGDSKWTTLRFTEDRLTTYVRRHFYDGHITCDIGLMHQFQNSGYTLYLSADIIVSNPFGLIKKMTVDDSSVGF